MSLLSYTFTASISKSFMAAFHYEKEEFFLLNVSLANFLESKEHNA